MNATFSQAEIVFRQYDGLLHASKAIALGITPRTLYAMRDAGVLAPVSRGLYRLADLPPFSEPDLVTVALRIPKAVICLISALAFHDLTTQIPHAVHVALPQDAEKPRLNYPPLRLYWLSTQAYQAGIEKHTVDGVMVKVYNAEKTVADCFKFRNKIGMEVAIEALKRYREGGDFRLPRLQHFARICRVDNVMRPYLEMLR